MHARLSCVASLLLLGLLGSACGEELQPPANQLPVLTGPSAQSTEVASGAAVALAVGATDADGDMLSYAWTQSPPSPAGTFNSTTAATPTWTAPLVAANTSFLLSVTVSDSKGGTARGAVTVVVRPPPPVNRTPAFTESPQASPASVVGASPVQLSALATDADNDALTYTWSQEPASPAGSFSDATSRTPTWTAPTVSSAQSFALKVTVSDVKGASVQGQVSVDVAPPVASNTEPVLTSGPSASSTTVDEQQSISLSVSATDADGDLLTYAWAQTAPDSPAGTFSSTSVSNPTWTAPDVDSSGTYTLRVTISDGQGGSVQASIDISVQKVNHPPDVAATISGPTTLMAGDTGTFSISASDPDGDTLTYSWEQTAPSTQGTWVGSRVDSSARWFSPAVGAQTAFTLSVTISDGQAPAVVRTLTVPVSLPRYAEVQSIWNTVPSCTSCHGTNGGLNLNQGVSHGNLVDVNTNNATCSSLKRVAPRDPDNSSLVRKLEGTTCGTRMPPNSTTYFTQNPGLLVRVRSWILAGANND